MAATARSKSTSTAAVREGRNHSGGSLSGLAWNSRSQLVPHAGCHRQICPGAAPPRARMVVAPLDLVSEVHGLRWWWEAVELVVEGRRGGQRNALSTASRPVREAHRPQIHGLIPRRVRSGFLEPVCQQAGGDESTHWHDTDKHSKTERWRGCWRRRAQHWKTSRVTLALAWTRWLAGAVMR